MNIEILKVGAKETHDWGHVVSWVYAHKPPYEDQYDLNPGEARYLAKLDGRPVGACTIYDMPVVRLDSNLKCGGVAGVATLPEFRGTGVADRLMRGILEEMRDMGHAISALYPYRSTYYRRFGYENCGWRWQIKCPQQRLPQWKPQLPIRQLSQDDIQRLDDVYVPFVRRRSGSIIRTLEDWHHRLGKVTPMVYIIGEPAEAYLWVNMDEFWGDANVGELAWTTRRGYETALSLVSSLCANQSSATWYEPPDSPFVGSHLDQGIVATLNRQTMYRVVDVKLALSSLVSTFEGSFEFAVEDDVCPWNAGVWKVGFGPSGTDVVPGSDPGFRIDVRHLVQAIMGQPSLSDLLREGKVEVTRQADLESAVQSLEPVPVVCMEFF